MSRRMIGVDARSGLTGGDTVPPNPPPSLASSAITTTTATITWSASTDVSGVDHYNVYDATPPSGGGGSTPTLLGTVAETTLSKAANFGTLVTQTAHAATEYASGSTVAMLELNWASYETADGVFSASYIASIQSQFAALQAAGMQVTLAMGVHHPPAWALAMTNAKQIDQTGAVTGQIDTIFNKQIRAKVEAYYTKIDADLGVENFWAIRLTSGGNAEMLHPGGNSYWAYGPNAQNGADMPTTMDPNPFPGWHAGGADHSITTAQVRTWATWYVDALVDVTDWQMQFFTGLGFTGYFQTLTPGSGRRPSVFTSDVNNYLPNSTTGVGAVWDVYYANLRNRTNVVVYISSVADGSGNDDFTMAGDNALALTDTTMNSWSATRWQTRIGHQYSMLVGGENPGFTTGGAPHYSDTTSLGLMAKSFAQVKGCGLFVFYWAHDDRLWDGTQTFANYSAGIALINTSVAGAVVNVFPNPDCVTGGTAFGTSNTTVTMGSTDYAANGVGSAKVTVGGSPTTSTFGYPAPASGDAVENGHGRYTAAVGDMFDVLFTVKAHASNAASVNILPKVVGYHWNGSANVASAGGETNGTPVLLAPGAVAVVAQRITVATPPTDPIDGVLIVPHIRSGANVANAPVAAAVIYLDRMAAVRNAPRPLTTSDWFDGASADASWGAAGANLASSTGALTSTAGALSFNLTGLAVGQHNTIWVTAVDASPAANESDPSIIDIATAGATDTTPPTVPTGLAHGIITPTTIDLTWAASSDDLSGVDHYTVTRSPGGATTNVDNTFTATGLAASTSYTFTVTATDGAGNTSPASSALVVSTSSAADTTAPSQVTGLGMDSIGTTTIAMSWTAATDNSGSIASYRIYWNGQAGGAPAATTFLHANTGSQLSYTATGLNPSTLYKFAVSATDPSANEGTKSGTVSATTGAVSGGSGMLLGLQGTNQHDKATGAPSLCRLGDRTPANGWTGTGGNVLVDGNGNGVNIGIMRSYYTPGAFPNAFDTGFATGGFGTNTHKRVQVCFKGNSPWDGFQSAATGGADIAIMRYINSIPSGWEVALTYHHEPNNDWSGTSTPANLYQAFMRIGALIEGRSMPSGQPAKNAGAAALALNSNVKVHQEPCFTIPTSATANDWAEVKNCLPHANLMDANAKLCVDAYQNPPPPISGSTYPTPGSILNYFLNNVLAQYGYATPAHGWTVGEWMAPLRDGDNANHDGQTAAISSYLNFCATASPQPAYRVCIWEDKFGETDGSGAKYNQTLFPQGKKVFVDFANGNLVRV